MSILSLVAKAARIAVDASKDLAFPEEIAAKRPLLVLDCYREEVEDGPGPLPEFEALFRARNALPFRYVGVVLKATQGTRYPTKWFKRVWQELRRVGGEEYARVWFRACYHYLEADQDGGLQGEFFTRVVEAAGGFDDGTMYPWLDIEWGSNQGASLQQWLDAIHGFVEFVESRLGRRVGVYGGRGVGYDLNVRNRFGLPLGTRWVQASYTETMRFAGLKRLGVRLEDVDLWQYDDGKIGAARTMSGLKLPSKVPGVRHGDLDVSVFVGGRTLEDFRRRMVTDSIITSTPAPAIAA